MSAVLSPPAPWRRPALGPRTRIWLLAGLVAATAAVLLLVAVPAEPVVPPPLHVPWLLLVLAFALGEAAVVHVHLHRESHSFSLTELVLVIGLYLTSPVALVLALVLGSGVTFVCQRRHGPVKLVFNLSLYALAGSLASITFAAVAGSDPTGPRGWLAALTAVLVATVAADLVIFVALSTVDGRVDLRKVPQMMGLSVPFTLGTTALALVGMRSLWSDPEALLLLVVPAMLLLLAYRAFNRGRRERANMVFLHQVSTLLHRGGDLEAALLEFLDTSRATFRANVAELTLFGADGEVSTTRSVEGAEPLELDRTAGQPADPTLQLLINSRGIVRTTSGADRDVDLANRYAKARGFKELMAIAVAGERLHGTLLVADRHGDVSTFDEGDVALFETLAQQVGQVLDNGHLEQSLRQVTQLKEELAHRASHDPLTGLANRGCFLEQTQRRLDAVHAAAATEPSDLDAAGPAGPTVLYLDLDGFKAINDSLGHDTGDALLQVVTDRLRGCVRAEDLVARLGGDEFGVLLREGHQMADAVATAERIAHRVGEPIDLGGRLVQVGTSIGIATTAGHASVDELIRHADAAMYAAKHAGGHRHAIYGADLRGEDRPRYTEAELAAAIDNDEIVVAYQPIVDLASGTLVGTEALVRWQHPTDGTLAPATFIPMAEKSELITRLGRRVLRQACHDVRGWLGLAGAGDLFVTVNLSAAQLSDPGLIADVQSALADAGIEPDSLLLEITETMLMRDMHAAAETLAGLKSIGVQVAIDDFGTGYSSLAYLRRFPVDMLKIAQEFTSGIDTNTDDDAITFAIVQLATSLGLRTVAEGIETAVQHSYLTGLKCSLGQGFLFSEAVQADLIRQMLVQERVPAGTAA